VALLAEKGANIQAQDNVRENKLSYKHACMHFIILISGIVFKICYV
jgi:hypothetical protein